MNYKAVFFDFDGTLGNRDVYAYNCYKAALSMYSGIDDPVYFEAVLQDMMIWDEQGNLNKREVYDKLHRKYGITFPLKDFNDYWEENLWKYTVAMDDAVPTLEALQTKYKLGIITNGNSVGQRKKVEISGLKQFFPDDAVIVSGDYGYHKPDVRLFQDACRKLKVKPEESVYVGDIFANDVLGSWRAGMKPVWIWTQGKRLCSADITVIHSLSELLDIL